MQHRAFVVFAAAALTALPAVAQQQVVNVYNWSDYIAEDTIAQFEAATGIRVVYDVYDSNETLEAKLLAGRSGYDVVVPTSHYLARQIRAGLYMPLDKSKLPNLAGMDEGLMQRAAVYDPDNAHAVIYLWGTTGIGYNVDKVAERLGADFEVDSWSLVFDPEIAAKLADCGISLLNESNDVLQTALNYLGLDPMSQNEADLEQAAALLESVRPYIRYFHSSQYITDLANGETCVAMGWSGDVLQAQSRAIEAENGVDVAYVIPKEGALVWFDMMAIPADAPNPEAAHAFINFVLTPEVMAGITNHVYFPNAVAASKPFVLPEILEDPTIYPTDEVQAKLFASAVRDPRIERTVTRLWTRVTTGR
jgi:putrescine transport system substrate-binding protein